MTVEERVKFPLRENCDPTNPEEAFLWMLVGLPGMQGAPLPFPVEYLRQVSKRLWDCGARPSTEPAIKYRRPSSSEPNWLTSPGSWVAVDEPDDVRDPLGEALAAMTAVQKGELLQALKGDLTSGPAAEAVASLTMSQRIETMARLLKGAAE